MMPVSGTGLAIAITFSAIRTPSPSKAAAVAALMVLEEAMELRQCSERCSLLQRRTSKTACRNYVTWVLLQQRLDWVLDWRMSSMVSAARFHVRIHIGQMTPLTEPHEDNWQGKQ